MGRVKGGHIKRAAHYLADKFTSQFGLDMAQNKLKLKEMKLLSSSKKEQNKLAGELTVYMKRKVPKTPEPIA